MVICSKNRIIHRLSKREGINLLKNGAGAGCRHKEMLKARIIIIMLTVNVSRLVFAHTSRSMANEASSAASDAEIEATVLFTFKDAFYDAL